MTAATAAVMLCAALIAAHVRGENAKYVLKKYAPAICSANALIFYVFFVLNATVLKRLSEPEYQPFSDIYGGWMVGELTLGSMLLTSLPLKTSLVLNRCV